MTGINRNRIQLKDAQTKCFTFSGTIKDVALIFEIIVLRETILIFVSDQEFRFRSLSMAIGTRFNNMPLSTSLIGDDPQSPINGIASRLSKRFKKLIYLSLNTNRDLQLLMGIEKALYDELKRLISSIS